MDKKMFQIDSREEITIFKSISTILKIVILSFIFCSF